MREGNDKKGGGLMILADRDSESCLIKLNNNNPDVLFAKFKRKNLTYYQYSSTWMLETKKETRK